MDTLRLMLLSLLIGATVSTSAAYTESGFNINQQIVFEQQQPAAANPTPRVVYITPQPASPTKKPSTGSASTSSGTIYTGTSITRELYRGCEGDDVRMLQRLLKDLNYNVTVDGFFGTQTRNAVIQFQKNNSLKADGIAGTRTIRKLVSSNAVPANKETQPRTTLSYGMTGQDVMDLQSRLSYLGYYHDIISGKYLTNTRNAVRWFQQNNNLSVDGIAGPLTLSRVYSPTAIAAGPKPPIWVPAPTTAPAFTRNLYKGLSGADVTYLQLLLADLNYFSGKPTGYFGSETEWAVRTFQSYNGLYSDGIAGQATFNRLLSGKAVPYPGTTAKPMPTTTAGPTNKPTFGPTSGPGDKCSHCGMIIPKGEEQKHNTRAWCGIHMICIGGDHNSKRDCGHYVCESGDHSGLGCGHYACAGGDHGKKGCDHYACESGDHVLHNCGVHYKCRYSGAEHTAQLSCGHYACDGRAHGAMSCGHPACATGDHSQQCFYCGAWYCQTSDPGGVCHGAGNETNQHNFM